MPMPYLRPSGSLLLGIQGELSFDLEPFAERETVTDHFTSQR